jgi:chromosome segregation ATPase
LAAGISGHDPLVPSLPRNIGIEVLQARLVASEAETLELRKKLKVVNEDRIIAREEVDRLLGAYHQEQIDHEAVRRELKKADQRVEAMKQETKSSTASHEKEMSRLKAQYKGNHKALKKEKKGLRTKITNIARSAKQDALTPAVIKVQKDLAGRKRRLRKQQSEIDRQRSFLQQARREQVPQAKEQVAQSQGGENCKMAAKHAEAARVASKASNHTTGPTKKGSKGGVQGQSKNTGQSASEERNPSRFC